MKKRRAAQRDELIEAGSDRLLAVGYRRTQIDDVAKAAGVAKGTFYSYIESKEALLDLVLRHEIDGFVPALNDLPYRTRSQREVNRFLEVAIGQSLRTSSLHREPSADRWLASDQLRQLISELYDVVERNWRAIKIIERSALDWPGLVELYYVEGRRLLHEPLRLFLKAGIESGGLRPVPYLPEATRFVIESLSWFGMNRRFGPGNEYISDKAARVTCVELTARAFCFDQADREVAG